MRIARSAALFVALAFATVVPPALRAAPSIISEIPVAPGLVAMTAPVSCGRYRDVAAWAERHGYRLPEGEGVCRRGPDSPAVALGWNTAAVWANALSEVSGRVPVYRDVDEAIARDAVTLGVAPTVSAGADGYRLPTLHELGLPRLRALMSSDIQVWTGSRIDLGDGKPYHYLCKPGACDFHSSSTSGRGVGFRLVRTATPGG